MRCIDELAVGLAPVVRMASALGPEFCAPELAAIVGSDVTARLDILVRDGLFTVDDGWYAFVDPSLAQAIYDHALDERSLVHERALHYWREHRLRDEVGWLARIAHHAAGSGDRQDAAASLSSLAREARERGDDEQAARLEQRAGSYRSVG
jgi:(2Fe-2S) ferredoxin